MKRLCLHLTVLLFCLPFTVAAEELGNLSAAQAAFNAGQYRHAFEQWRQLAETGNAEAQVFVGLAYAKGWGVEKDMRAASKWYLNAAENGSASGQFLLGIYYIKGNQTQTRLGLQWLRRAAANGDESADKFLQKAQLNGWFRDMPMGPVATLNTDS